jgi:hypothetical protein
MANVLIPILAGNLPTNYCFPASPQQLLNDFAATMSALLPGGMAYYNYGDTAPAVQYQGYPWLYTNTMRWYQYVGGLWISPHPYPASGGARIMFTTGTESDIWDFDGGDGNDPGAVPPTTYTGAMWEADPAFAGRSPMHPGAIPGSVGPKTLLEEENYGSAIHNITDANSGGFVSHVHVYGRMLFNHTNDDFRLTEGSAIANAGLSGPWILGGDAVGTPNPSAPMTTDILGNPMVGPYLNTGPQVAQSGTTVTDIPVENVHPVRGVWIIRRTNRAFYTAP